jgi:D-alanyl-lipoteichoic acid acyltransferase DltB (MBOAT superfamily)
LLRNYNNNPNAFYNKPRLLVLIASIIISLSVVPFILPHVFHPHMIYHIILHLVALIISQFLAVVSLLAYLKVRTTRILFMTLGFMTLVVAGYVYLLNSTEDFHVMSIPQINIEVSHVILLIMVMFFGISFLKNPR